MNLYHIVAFSENRVIGKDNKLPWHFSADLKHFKETTMGSTILMGRKTFESIGKPLPGRENFVLSKVQHQSNSDHLKYFTSIEDALKNVQTPKAFIIGGASLYEQTIEKVDGIYLTQIHATFEGDAFYPEIPNYFKIVSKAQHNEKNTLLEFIFLQKT